MPRALKRCGNDLRSTLTREQGLDVAERTCDRVVMLQRGRVIAAGTLAELRGSRGDATLEQVFLELTRAPEGPA